MKTALCAAALGVAMLTGYGLSAPPAEAGYVVTLTQQGPDVVATGSGPIDLTGLSFLTTDTVYAFIRPSLSAIETGPTSFVPLDAYQGTSGPTSFGSGGFTGASSGSGDIVGIANGILNGVGFHHLIVPLGYVSDTPLSDTATYAGETLSGLGVTPGTYEWTWGVGANQNFTLDIVPELSTWAMMALGFGFLGLLGYRKTRSALA
jgi:hypothetical protein